MAKVKNKNTHLEVDFRKILWGYGLRYRLGYKLIGKPDVVFVSAKVALFVDGCFWHGCPLHGQQPKTNTSFWAEKLTKNQLRDQRVNEELARLGWLVVRFWEHELKEDVHRCAQNLIEIVRTRINDGAQIHTTRPRNP